MNARRLAKIAATLANLSEELVESSQVHERFDAETYWESCEQRLKKWNQALALFKADLMDEDGHRPWPALTIIVEEIFYSEILTRIWTAVFSISQRNEIDREKEAIVRAVWIGHLAARSQSLQLIYLGQQSGDEAAQKLDALRKKLERWSDILLSRFSHLGDLSQFAFDVERMNEWAHEQEGSSAEHRAQQWSLLKESLNKALDDCHSHPAANPDLNRQIALTISSCLPQEKVESAVSSPDNKWLARLTDKASEMQKLIDEYIANAG